MSCVHSLYKSLFPDSSRGTLLWHIYVIFQNYYSRVFSWTTKNQRNNNLHVISCIYLISIYATKFSCLNEHLSFVVNSQKSQFVGIVESRAANFLYLIAEDIAETKNVILTISS